MLTWVFIFLAVAVVAGIFGFTGIVDASVGIAKMIFFVFIVLFIISLVMHLGHISL
jgi:uncharacterized membrane protein YtjA (UPF0391 family)